MPKEEWGVKRVCPTTGKRFYDLNKDPIVSPYTGEIVELETGKSRSITADAEDAETKKLKESDAGTDTAVVTFDIAEIADCTCSIESMICLRQSSAPLVIPVRMLWSFIPASVVSSDSRCSQRRSSVSTNQSINAFILGLSADSIGQTTSYDKSLSIINSKG